MPWVDPAPADPSGPVVSGDVAAASAKVEPSPEEVSAAEVDAEAENPPTFRPLRVTPNSNVAAASYSQKTMELLVTFVRDDRQYKYSAIPADVIAEMERAEDTGKFFYWRIRTAYPYKEVG